MTILQFFCLTQSRYYVVDLGHSVRTITVTYVCDQPRDGGLERERGCKHTGPSSRASTVGEQARVALITRAAAWRCCSAILASYPNFSLRMTLKEIKRRTEKE